MSAATGTSTALVQSYFDAVAKNDLETLEALVSHDFVQHPPPLGAVQDRDVFVTEWRSRIEEDPDNSLVYERDHRLTETIEVGPREGEWVHEWGTYRRTDQSLAFKLSASFRVADGHISEIRAYFDRLDIMTQGGFTLTPPQ